MKAVKFGNDGLRECVMELGQFGIRAEEADKTSPQKDRYLEHYEPKFLDIIKKVNHSTIEIDLVKSLLKTMS